MEYLVKYNLHKDKTPVIDGYNTGEERETAIKALLNDGYNPIRITDSPESIKFHLSHSWRS